mmetsp:Transcript_44596/g.78386  ORF Transcript_44596/g.78386 Transcript_44596/m.78386 type:complete len:87 (+) Transcript_44596:483-743(+)
MSGCRTRLAESSRPGRASSPAAVAGLREAACWENPPPDASADDLSSAWAGNFDAFCARGGNNACPTIDKGGSSAEFWAALVAPLLH